MPLWDVGVQAYNTPIERYVALPEDSGKYDSALPRGAEGHDGDHRTGVREGPHPPRKVVSLLNGFMYQTLVQFPVTEVALQTWGNSSPPPAVASVVNVGHNEYLDGQRD